MKNYRIEAIILAIGTLMLGVFIYWGLSAFAAKDRVVDVRGLAEREVKADKVIWPITYKTTGNDLQTIYTDLNNVNDRIARPTSVWGLPKLLTCAPNDTALPTTSKRATATM